LDAIAQRVSDSEFSVYTSMLIFRKFCTISAVPSTTPFSPSPVQCILMSQHPSSLGNNSLLRTGYLSHNHFQPTTNHKKIARLTDVAPASAMPILSASVVLASNVIQSIAATSTPYKTATAANTLLNGRKCIISVLKDYFFAILKYGQPESGARHPRKQNVSAPSEAWRFLPGASPGRGEIKEDLS